MTASQVRVADRPAEDTGDAEVVRRRSVSSVDGLARARVALHGVGTVGGRFAALAAAAGVRLERHRSTGPIDAVAARADVLVDCTPPAYEGPRAQAWVARLAEALRGGTHVVTCNKAPLAIAGRELADAARDGGARIADSATVGGGTPVLATLRRVHAVHGVARVEASLSGTLAYVVSRVAAGAGLEAAVREAQAVGLAEPDPRLDLDGTDTAAKAVVLHNALYGEPAGRLRLADVHEPLELREADIRSWTGGGVAPAVLAHVAPGHVSLRLGPALGPVSPSAIRVRAVHRDGGSTELAGPGAGAGATAAALLADLRDLLA